ncbi:Paramyosin [Amphibalanus amphitrite]|uniref:Paramyosin n=1 Tax=Amphibalanus amphitrite TaxID=1232801 RepID=A0A6A4WAH4_AMPAM|nr:Paramyosin [Amphibalanus amphitrite]
MSSSKTTTRKYTYTSSGGAQSDVKVEYHTDQMALARMEDRIRQLHDDLESERELRQRVSRTEGCYVAGN